MLSSFSQDLITLTTFRERCQTLISNNFRFC